MTKKERQVLQVILHDPAAPFDGLVLAQCGRWIERGFLQVFPSAKAALVADHLDHCDPSRRNSQQGRDSRCYRIRRENGIIEA